MIKHLIVSIQIPNGIAERINKFFERWFVTLVILALTAVSVYFFIFYLQNGLGLAYNDARSHLNIGRRVVEGLKPGIAQLGSVWLPLPHILMIPTIWHDFFWHSGLSGALPNMLFFVITGAVVYLYLKELGMPVWAGVIGVLVFVFNTNVLYLQSTAMTEILLLATMTLGSFELMRWHKYENLVHLIKAAFWIMLSTLSRYDGWFLLFIATLLVAIRTLAKKGYKTAEGTTILFCTLAALGILLWLGWNLLIFKDPFYFAFGPYSAYAQQLQLASANVLPTKFNLWLSAKFYLYALAFNSNAFILLIGVFGLVTMFLDKNLSRDVKVANLTLLAPLGFNILALFLGHSVLHIQGLSGDTWFNVRYGIMLMPALAISIGYLISKAGHLKPVVLGLTVMSIFFMFTSEDIVTIDDARVGSSQKNVSEVSGWLKDHATNERGFILISAASHDAIIFSSGLPMKRFIHEGTGLYWETALALPDRWARWIIMRTYDDNDLAYRGVSKTEGFAKYDKVGSFPFADIYELRPEYLNELNTEPVFGRQK